jgi:hypothetical protein
MEQQLEWMEIEPAGDSREDTLGVWDLKSMTAPRKQA